MANETTTKTVATGTQLSSVGTVKTVIGLVKAIDVNGNERVLQAGDHVYPGETIQTAGDGAVLVEFPNGGHLDLPHSSHIVLDPEIYQPASDSVEKQAEDEAARIERAIAEGRDPSVETDAAAAGGAGGDEGSSSPLVVGFNNTQGSVASGFQTAPIANSVASAQHDQQPTIPEAAPTITAATTGASVFELANTTGSKAQDAVSGTISFADINPADTHAVSVKAEGSNYVGTFTPTVVADSTQTPNGTGTVAWTFNVQDGALDFLAAGQTLTQKYDVTVDDGRGGQVTQVVTITVTGTNDAPVITTTSNALVQESFENLITNSWTVLDSSFIGDHGVQWSTGEGAGLEVQAGNIGGASASDGNVKAELDSDHTASNKTGSTLVTLSTQVQLTGQEVTLSFDYMPRPEAGADGIMKVSLVDAQGHEVYSRIVTNADTTSWQTFTADIAGAPAGTYTLTFQGLGKSDNYGAYLDNIKLVANPFSGSVVEAADNSQDEISKVTHTTSGNIAFADVDLSDAHTVSFKAEGSNYLGTFTPSVATDSTGSGAGNVTWTFKVADDALNALAEGQVLTQKYDVTIDDGHVGAVTQTVTITIVGTNDAPVVTSDDNSDGAHGAEDATGIAIQLSASDVDGTIASFKIGTLPDHGKLYLGNTELFAGDTVPANGNGATLTFVPAHDWSGGTSFTYTAIDNNGASSTSAQAKITVDPVTDTPTVDLTVTVQTPFDSYTADVTTVSDVLIGTTDKIAHPAGFTITAYDQNGNVGEIYTSTGNGPSGIGVVGDVPGNDGAGGVEIAGNEKIVVQLDTPATSVSYQLAFLRGSDKAGGVNKMEYADITVHYSDGTSQTRVISGDETQVNGHSDKVSPIFTVDAPSGKTITSIDFQADSNNINNDFLVHSVSYQAATQTFSVGITATPSDADFSEHISQPLNVMITDESGHLIPDAKLVGYTQNSDGSYSIPLDDSHVSIDAKTGVVSVSDLSVTVSTDVHSFNVTATATAQDGAATPVSNADAVHVLSGTSGNDTLQALTGNYVLIGGAGDDTLAGDAGNDILVGGSGDELLTGGKGSDAFIWKSGETGKDTITDFQVGDGGDVLNLADLLHGEHANAGSLDNYLTFSTNNSGDTVISIHADGPGSAVTQTITLQGVDLVTGHNSADIIKNLLDHGNLKTDA